MKKFLILFLFISFGSYLQAQEISHTFDPEECQSIRVSIPSDHISSKEWDQSQIKLEISVQANMPIEIVRLLEKRDRYLPAVRKEGDVLIIELPNVNKTVIVKGRPLKEELYVNLFSPLDLSVYEDRSQLELLREFSGRSGDQSTMSKIPYEIQVDLQLNSQIKGNTSGILDQLQHGDIKIDGQAIDIIR